MMHSYETISFHYQQKRKKLHTILVMIALSLHQRELFIYPCLFNMFTVLCGMKSDKAQKG